MRSGRLKLEIDVQFNGRASKFYYEIHLRQQFNLKAVALTVSSVRSFVGRVFDGNDSNTSIVLSLQSLTRRRIAGVWPKIASISDAHKIW
jgi:hypothetical protein